jgi:hypothetical protein
MPLRTCAKCGRPSQGRYCPEHQRQEDARRTNKVTRYGYKSAHWQAVRKQRLELAGHICELRLAGCTIRATHVHLPAGYEGQHGQPASGLPRLLRLLLRRYRWSTQPLLLEA